MEWIFVALVIGVVGYCAVIVVEYTNYALQIKPRIAHLETEAADLVRDMNSISLEKDASRIRSETLKTSVSELGDRLRDLRSKLLIEKSRKQRLDMEAFKLRLKGRLGPAMA
jgi:acetylglutamate synthase